MEPKTAAEVGMYVTFTRHDHKHVPHGRGGVIDIVDPKTGAFQVLTDCGGFFAWTTFESWEWTGKRLARTTETEGWFAARENL
jgi:hypothetical protein